MVLVGAVAGAFGVRGEVRVRSFTADPGAIAGYGPLMDEAGRVILTPLSWRPVTDAMALSAREVETREQAMALRNTRLYVPRGVFAQPEEDEYYHVDLIGLSVEGLDGRALGRVRAIATGAQDLLDIEGTPGASGRWFLPFTRMLAPHVDLAGGRIVIDPPDGLIPWIEPAP